MQYFTTHQAVRMNRRRFQTRHLAFQQLEERLALSTIPVVGFVAGETATEEIEIIQNISPLLGGGFVDLIPGSPKLNGLDSIHGGGFTLTSGYTSDSDMTIRIIALPELATKEPGGGLVIISPEFSSLASSIPASQSQFSLEATEYTSQEKNQLPGQSLDHELAPSRGRAISLRVATVALPGSATGRSLHAPIEATNSSPTKPALSGTARQQPTAFLPPHISPASLDHVFDEMGIEDHYSDSENFSARHMRVSQHAITMMASDHYLLATPSHNSAERNNAVNPSEEATTVRPVVLDSSEDEVRNQVFADWRNRDLIVVPVFLGLAVGTLLVRHQGTKAADTHQLPPKRQC